MLKNNKGFTVIELIMSFLFSSILAISLFSVIVSYRNKQTDSTIETEILAFKSHLIMDIQEDIQLKGLKSIEYCPGSEPGTIISRCVILNFNGNPGTSKTLQLSTENKVDTITNFDNTESQFYYTIPYIVYGDIRYDIPDAANVYIDDDYILQTTSPTDGIESGTSLYKVSFNLKHSDLDTDVNISFVASGSISYTTNEGPYKVYNLGDSVSVQVNDLERKNFRVIEQYSNSYKDDLVLLYDDAYDANLVKDSTNFNVVDNVSNRYISSAIKNEVHDIEVQWFNAETVRLITVDEVARIAALCPKYKGADAPEISISTAPTWLTNKNFWTMTEKEASGDDFGKKVWYVKGSARTLSFDKVDKLYALRPVIIIKKAYVVN